MNFKSSPKNNQFPPEQNIRRHRTVEHKTNKFGNDTAICSNRFNINHSMGKRKRGNLNPTPKKKNLKVQHKS